MISKILDNITADLYSKGYHDRKFFDDVKDSIAMELGKYEWKEKETSIVIYDDTDARLIQKFFVAKATMGLSPRSLKFYKASLSRSFSMIGKHIKDITSDDIRACLTRMRLEGAKNISLDNARRVLNSFFVWAVEEEYITKNPVSKVKKIKCEKVVKKALTEDEMEKIRLFARTDRDRAVIEFLYSTGCRVSEMTALNRNDINWEGREVVVLGKGNKERKVFLSSRCLITLKKYLDGRKDKEPSLFVSECKMFGREKDIHRFTVSGVECMVRSIGKRAGIEKVHPHRIRRTAATVALRRGMPIEQVSKMLGHEDLKTTTIYANSTMEDVKNSHEKYLT